MSYDYSIIYNSNNIYFSDETNRRTCSTSISSISSAKIVWCNRLELGVGMFSTHSICDCVIINNSKCNNFKFNRRLIKMKPTLGKLKVYYDNYLVKIRDGRLCFMCLDENNNIRLFSKDSMPFHENGKGFGGVICFDRYDVDLHNTSTSDEYDIVATKQCKSEIEPIRRVYSNKEPAVWDWCEEDDVQEMTLAEVCKALGKNIKIIKE